MPFYLYKCTSKECGFVNEEVRRMGDRENDGTCPKCNSKTSRKFDPNAGNIVMWRDPNTTRATTSGPTRKNHYKVRDVADEKGWWPKWGIDRPAHK